VPFANTAPLRKEIATRLPERPFTIEFWDGSSLPSTSEDGPTFSVRSPKALAHALRAPGQLGLGRAYVSGELEVDDIDKVIRVLDGWRPPALDKTDQRALMLAAVRAMGIVKPPPRPAAELRPSGKRHSKERDARAVRHHYDVSNEFFELFLGPTMVYSCAIWRHGEMKTLEQAQEEKLDTVARKLQIKEGERILDVGCGWGGFPLWAATKYGANVVGITLSPPQGRKSAEAGRGSRRRRPGRHPRHGLPRPALARREVRRDRQHRHVEHVGSANIDLYAETLASLLDSGGRLLNHGITRLRHTDPEAGDFSERYVFPDAAPLHLSRNLLALERAGFVVHHVEDFGPDYAQTLKHWAENLDANRAEGERLAGAERMRVWRLYLRMARNGFENGFLNIYQARCSKP